MSDCLFCGIEKSRIVLFSSLAYAIYDRFPVTEGHALIIPKRHVNDYFDLSHEEILACNQILQEMRKHIVGNDSKVKGFNIGMNVGAVAGQSILHCHMHLIPRRQGDVEEPRGGIRHLIPGKGLY